MKKLIPAPIWSSNVQMDWLTDGVANGHREGKHNKQNCCFFVNDKSCVAEWIESPDNNMVCYHIIGGTYEDYETLKTILREYSDDSIVDKFDFCGHYICQTFYYEND